MAVKLAKKNNQFNMQVRTFYIDSVDDLAVIETQYDCGIGDRAELPDGTVYCRHSDGYGGDLWEKKGSSGGGGGGSGSVLPAVTTSDNGDILAVVDGTWDKKAPDYSIQSETIEVIPNIEISATEQLPEGAYIEIVNDFTAPLLDSGGSAKVTLTIDGHTISFVMPISNMYPMSEGWVIGEYDYAEQGQVTPVFTTYPICLAYAPEDGVLAFMAQDEVELATIQAIAIQDAFQVSDDFIRASNYAASTIIICPTQTIVQTDQPGQLPFSFLAYADSFDPSTIAQYLNEATVVTVNGIRLIWDEEQPMWHAEDPAGVVFNVGYTGGGYTGGTLAFACVTSDDPHLVPGEYEVCVRAAKAHSQDVPDYAIVRMNVTLGDVSCNYTYDQLYDMIQNGTPLVAFINNLPCVTLPERDIPYGDNLVFSAISIIDLGGRGGELSVSRCNIASVDEYSYCETEYYVLGSHHDE